MTFKTLEEKGRTNVSRREVLGLLGATAAASLVVGAGEEYVSAEQTQSTSSRIVRIDAKPEAIAININKDCGSRRRYAERFWL